jgi:hypothetical protein
MGFLPETGSQVPGTIPGGLACAKYFGFAVGSAPLYSS